MAFYDSISLEKGMYGANGQGFTASLESIDPSVSYKGTELEGLDAFERQLKRFGIKVKGAGSDIVDKFFASSQSAALFPEYVRRSVAQGMSADGVLPDIAACVTAVDTPDYRPLASVLTAADKTAPVVAEGAEIPATQIKLRDSLVTLKKRGRMLVTSYEAIRFQRLDLFSVTLRQIGACIARSQVSDAIGVLLNGDLDDGSNAAGTVSPAAANSLTYSDLVKLWGEFTDFEMNRLIAGPKMMARLLAMEEFRNPLTGLNFQGTGRLSTPLGATLYRSNAAGEDTLLAFDKNCALEMVVAAEAAVDFDKLIDRQLERATVTSIAGFAKIFSDSVKKMTVSA